MTDETTCALPEGEYAIVEMMGHRTIIGRVTEVERFGATFMQVEPVHESGLLTGVLVAGASLYQFTPITRAVAWEKRPREEWQYCPEIRALIPPQAPEMDFCGTVSEIEDEQEFDLPAFLQPVGYSDRLNATRASEFTDDLLNADNGAD